MAIFESVRGTLVQLERSKFVCDACLTSHREISNWVSKYFVSFAFLRCAIGLKKTLALLSPPIRCKIKTNCDLVTRVFPALLAGNLFLPRVLIGSLWYSSLFLLAYGITLVLIVWHSVDINSITLHSGWCYNKWLCKQSTPTANSHSLIR